MIQKRWKSLAIIAFVFGIQGSFAAETWLLITSDLPGTAISVDDTYRGTTPQRPGDTLRIQVSEGTRVIVVRKRFNGKEYAARQTVEVTGKNENLVQFNLRKKTASVSVTQTAPSLQDSKPQFGTVVPFSELEVPGRNF